MCQGMRQAGLFEKTYQDGPTIGEPPHAVGCLPMHQAEAFAPFPGQSRESGASRCWATGHVNSATIDVTIK
jgi:hypothetical protein